MKKTVTPPRNFRAFWSTTLLFCEIVKKTCVLSANLKRCIFTSNFIIQYFCNNFVCLFCLSVVYKTVVGVSGCPFCWHGVVQNHVCAVVTALTNLTCCCLWLRLRGFLCIVLPNVCDETCGANLMSFWIIGLRMFWDSL